MVSSNKFKVDFLKAKEEREKLVDFLNSQLPRSFIITRIHPHLQTMSINKKVENNKVSNRIQASSIISAMGLAYVLRKEEDQSEIPIQFFISKSIYLKTPYEYKENWKGFLDLLHSLNYHFIVADPKNNKFSDPIPVKTFISWWKPSLCSSKGNRNRITFHGAASAIYLADPNEKNILGESMISKLIKLFDK